MIIESCIYSTMHYPFFVQTQVVFAILVSTVLTRTALGNSRTTALHKKINILLIFSLLLVHRVAIL